MGAEEVKIVSAALCFRRCSCESQERCKEGAVGHTGSRKGFVCVFWMREM